MEIGIAVDDGALRDAQGAIHALPVLVGARVGGKALAAWAREARKVAVRSRSFVDRTGRLRASIKVYRRRTRIGRVKVAGGKAVLFAGGAGARQAYLVERGHSGPKPAPPKVYLLDALNGSAVRGARSFTRVAVREMDRIAAVLASGPTRKRETLAKLTARSLREVGA